MGVLDVKDNGNRVVREYDNINSLNIARFFIAVRETYPVSQKVHIIFDGTLSRCINDTFQTLGNASSS